jgi:hypothetical protein
MNLLIAELLLSRTGFDQQFRSTRQPHFFQTWLSAVTFTSHGWGGSGV